MSGYLRKAFIRTGIAVVDDIIQEIENAGDSYHHTDRWRDDEYGPSCIDKINEKITIAANTLKKGDK